MAGKIGIIVLEAQAVMTLGGATGIVLSLSGLAAALGFGVTGIGSLLLIISGGRTSAGRPGEP